MDNISIRCYVTTRGGVVVMNGPFPIEKANRVANLCDAAPDLFEAARELLTALKGTYLDDLRRAEEHMEKAIAKAEGQEAEQALQHKEGE